MHPFPLIALLTSFTITCAAPIPQLLRRQTPTPAQISSLLGTITDQSTLTIPADAIAAFETLASGGALSDAEGQAVDACSEVAREFNTASKAQLGSLAGNIIFDANKIALHACEGARGSATALNLLVSNIGNINVQLSRLAGVAPPVLPTLVSSTSAGIVAAASVALATTTADGIPTPAGISSFLATITDQSTITIPSSALSAFSTLAAGGALSDAEGAAVDACAQAARDNNTASKAELGSTAGNIVFDANKIALHACEGARGSNTALTLLASNVGNMNVQLSRLDGAAPPPLATLV